MEQEDNKELESQEQPETPENPETSEAPVKKKKKRIAKCIGAVVLALLIALLGFLGGWFGYYYSLDEEIRSFLWAYEVAKKNFYRPLDETDFYENLFSALDLDPYSGYYTPDAYSDYQDRGEGQNKGIGVSLTNETSDGVTVPRVFIVYENSPACNAGVRKGMYVFGFGNASDELTTGDSSAIVSFVGSTEGEFVLSCGYERDGSDAQIYTMQREAYQAAFVHYRDSEGSLRIRYEHSSSRGELVEGDEALPFLDTKTAYIRLDEFSGNAAEEFIEVLRAMKERGRIHLILDLRTNGGGYLKTFQKIASYLLRDVKNGTSPIVARAIFRNGSDQIYRASNCDFSCFTEGSRIVLLTDENTASASECLIGALVDYGTVNMEDIFLRQNTNGVAKTYGKGIMQSHFSALSGAAMKLTVAEIVWPSGKSIHGVGVIPEDGATPVQADLIWGNFDPMLEEAAKRISG